MSEIPVRLFCVKQDVEIKTVDVFGNMSEVVSGRSFVFSGRLDIETSAFDALEVLNRAMTFGSGYKTKLVIERDVDSAADSADVVVEDPARDTPLSNTHDHW